MASLPSARPCVGAALVVTGLSLAFPALAQTSTDTPAAPPAATSSASGASSSTGSTSTGSTSTASSSSAPAAPAAAPAAPGDSAGGSLGTVVVSATGYEQNIADAPASISVITREQLEKQPYTDIVDAVRNIPGVSITGGGNSQDISIRGMAASYTLYLVDGRPVSAGRSVNTNGADGGKQIVLPPLSAIERIEVIRGPMSSLYGSDAMGGVVNIITRKAGGAWRGQVATEFILSDNEVSNNGQNHSFFAGGPLVPGLLGLKVNGGYTGYQESSFVGGSDNAESRPESKRREGGFELTLTPDMRNTFGLSMQMARQDTYKTAGRSLAVGSAESSYRFDKDVYALTHTGRYGNLRLNSYLQHDVSDKVQEQMNKETVSTLNSQATYLWGDHVFTFGGQYRYEKLTNETNGLLVAGAGRVPLEGAVASADRWLAALFAEADWRTTERFSLTTGLRYNRDEFFGGHFTPRLYGLYRLTPEWTMKGGVSTGYKQPSLSQSTAGIGTTTGGGGSPVAHSRALIIGNPDLKPEKSTSFEIGTAFQSLDRTLSASLMVFHTQFKDKIAEDRYCTSPGAANNNDYANWACPFGGNTYYFLSTNQNIDKATMQGVEATYDHRILPNLRVISSYTYTRSEQKTGTFAGQPLNKQPRHMLNAMVDWQITPQWNTWVQANYRSRTSDFLSRTTMGAGTPGYALFDMGLVYRINKTARVKAGVYNLANKRITNENFGVVLDGRRYVAGLTFDF